MNLEQGLQLPKPALLKRVVLAALAAIVIVAAIVMPAEYGIDPTGFGRLTGLLALSHQNETVTSNAGSNTASNASKEAATSTLAQTSNVPFRTDTISIPLAAEGEEGYELEYKVRMKAGSTLVYSWTTPANVYYDFHSESDDKPKPRVISHRIEDDAMQSHGSLSAPFDGIHGWYWQNHDTKANKVTLKMSGFYELHEKKP
jgi:hypothetical protein